MMNDNHNNVPSLQQFRPPQTGRRVLFQELASFKSMTRSLGKQPDDPVVKEFRLAAAVRHRKEIMNNAPFQSPRSLLFASYHRDFVGTPDRNGTAEQHLELERKSQRVIDFTNSISLHPAVPTTCDQQAPETLTDVAQPEQNVQADSHKPSGLFGDVPT